MSLSPGRRLALALACASVVSVWPLLAGAQPTQARHFDWPAQPLAQALNELARQSGQNLLVDPTLVGGRQAPALQGSYSVSQALERLLAGSGLKGRVDDQVILVQPTAADTVSEVSTLAPVTVTGSERQTASSPVYGMVAQRSSTGIKTDSDLLEIPQSVTVVTREQIELQGASGLDESLRYTPGVVSAAYGPDSRSDWLMVRGFKPAIFLDGLAMPAGNWTQQTRIEPYALERVEVLRGTSSALYGALPPSGFVNAVSKRPQDTPRRELGLSLGSYQKKQLTADFTGPLNDDGTVLYRLVGLARDGKTELDHSYDRRYMLAPSLTWQPNADTSLTVLSLLQRADVRSVAGFLPAQGTLLPNPHGRISRSFYAGEPDFDRYRKDMRSIGYLFAHRWSPDLTLRQNVRFNHSVVDHPTVGPLGLAEDKRSLNRYVFTPYEVSRTWTLDNQAEYLLQAGGLDHTILAGLDYRQAHNDYSSGYGGGVAPIDVFNPVYGSPVVRPAVSSHTRQKTEQWGLYLQDQIRWGEGWVATLSGRHDRVRIRTDNMLSEQRASQRDSEWSGRAGLSYVFDNGLAPYVSYSTSFEPVSGTQFDGTAFRPSTGRQWEAGLKYRSDDDAIQLTAAVYTLDQKNVLTQDPVHLFEQVQQGKVRSRGLELEGRMKLNDNLTMIASYALTDSRMLHSTVAADQGKRVPMQPRHQAGLWADYRFSPASSLAGLGLGGGVRYVGSSYGDSANLWETPSYTLVDAQAHYDFDKWRLLLTVNNLTNKDYVSTCSSAIWCYYGYGRNISLSARYVW